MPPAPPPSFGPAPPVVLSSLSSSRTMTTTPARTKLGTAVMAATRIQSCWRKYWVSSDYQLFLTERQAAVVIQAYARRLVTTSRITATTALSGTSTGTSTAISNGEEALVGTRDRPNENYHQNYHPHFTHPNIDTTDPSPSFTRGARPGPAFLPSSYSISSSQSTSHDDDSRSSGSCYLTADEGNEEDNPAEQDHRSASSSLRCTALLKQYYDWSSSSSSSSELEEPELLEREGPAIPASLEYTVLLMDDDNTRTRSRTRECWHGIVLQTNNSSSATSNDTTMEDDDDDDEETSVRSRTQSDQEGWHGIVLQESMSTTVPANAQAAAAHHHSHRRAFGTSVSSTASLATMLTTTTTSTAASSLDFFPRSFRSCSSSSSLSMIEGYDTNMDLEIDRDMDVAMDKDMALDRDVTRRQERFAALHQLLHDNTRSTRPEIEITFYEECPKDNHNEEEIRLVTSASSSALSLASSAASSAAVGFSFAKMPSIRTTRATSTSTSTRTKTKESAAWTPTRPPGGAGEDTTGALPTTLPSPSKTVATVATTFLHDDEDEDDPWHPDDDEDTLLIFEEPEEEEYVYDGASDTTTTIATTNNPNHINCMNSWTSDSIISQENNVQNSYITTITNTALNHEKENATSLQAICRSKESSSSSSSLTQLGGIRNLINFWDTITTTRSFHGFSSAGTADDKDENETRTVIHDNTSTVLYDDEDERRERNGLNEFGVGRNMTNNTEAMNVIKLGRNSSSTCNDNHAVDCEAALVGSYVEKGGTRSLWGNDNDDDDEEEHHSLELLCGNKETMKTTKSIRVAVDPKQFLWIMIAIVFVVCTTLIFCTILYWIVAVEQL